MGNIFTQEILNGAINPYYVFAQFLKNSLKCELTSPIQSRHQLNISKIIGDDLEGYVELSFTVKHLGFNRFATNSQSKQVVHSLTYAINNFFKQHFDKCGLTYYDDDTYSVSGILKLKFGLSRNFRWGKITEGLAVGDIAGFCTPEEEALLEPHLFDVELDWEIEGELEN